MRGPKGPDPAPRQLNFYYARHSQISFVFLRYIKIHLSCWAFAFSGLSVSNTVWFSIQSLHSQLWSNIWFSEKTSPTLSCKSLFSLPTHSPTPELLGFSSYFLLLYETISFVFFSLFTCLIITSRFSTIEYTCHENRTFLILFMPITLALNRSHHNYLLNIWINQTFH